MNPEQYINEQVDRMLMVYNEELKRERGDHHVRRILWLVLGSACLFIVAGILRSGVH